MTRLIPTLAVNPCKITCRTCSQTSIKYVERKQSSLFCLGELCVSPLLLPVTPTKPLYETSVLRDAYTDRASCTLTFVFIFIFCPLLCNVRVHMPSCTTGTTARIASTAPKDSQNPPSYRLSGRHNSTTTAATESAVGAS